MFLCVGFDIVLINQNDTGLYFYGCVFDFTNRHLNVIINK